MKDKKLVALTVVAAMVATMLFCSTYLDLDESDAAGSNELALSVDSANLREAGKEVSVSINIDKNPGIHSLRIKVIYDTAFFTLKSVDSHIETLAFGNVNVSNHPVVLYAEVTDINVAVTATGKLATLTFESNESTLEGQYPIYVEPVEAVYIDQNIKFHNVPISVSDAVVIVGNILHGDVNNDGKITAADSLMLRKHLAGNEVPSVIRWMDINRDGNVTSVDSLMLRKHLAGNDMGVGKPMERNTVIFDGGDSQFIVNHVVVGLPVYLSLQEPFRSAETNMTTINFMELENGRYSFTPVSNGGNSVKINLLKTTLCTIDFMVDGNLLKTVEYYSGSTFEVPDVPKKDGYKESWSPYEMDVKQQVVNAVYEVVDYSITYNLNGGSISTPNPSTYDVETSVVLTSPTKVGCQFMGWYDENNNRYDRITPGMFGNIVLNAVWDVERYVATFVADGRVVSECSFTYGGSIVEPSIPEKTGYEGAWDRYELGNKDITVNAIYTPKKYTISYELNGGKVITGNPSEYTIESDFQFTEPTKDNYNFLGWYDDSGVRCKGMSPGNTGNKSFEARWSAEAYTITFMANGSVYSTVTYDREHPSVEIPDVPLESKTTSDGVWYYNGKLWNQELTFEDITVVAHYDGKYVLANPYYESNDEFMGYWNDGTTLLLYYDLGMIYDYELGVLYGPEQGGSGVTVDMNKYSSTITTQNVSRITSKVHVNQYGVEGGGVDLKIGKIFSASVDNPYKNITTNTTTNQTAYEEGFKAEFSNSENTSMEFIPGLNLNYQYRYAIVGNVHVYQIVSHDIYNNKTTIDVVYAVEDKHNVHQHNGGGNNFSSSIDSIYMVDVEGDIARYSSNTCYNLTPTYQDGNEQVKYQEISKVADLLNIRPDGHYILTRDIDMNGQIWTPISFSSGSVFNGNGHTISNLSISTTNANTGMFSSNNGVIKNLIISNATVSSNKTGSGTILSSVLVASNGGEITNCTIMMGKITHVNSVTEKNTKHYVGMIAGQNSGKITFCSVIDGSITVKSTVKARGNDTTIYTGGIVGNNSNIVSNSVVTSTSFSFNASQKWHGVGIIEGLHRPEVNLYVGGLIGYCASDAQEVSYCFSDVKSSSFVISVDIGSYGNMWGTKPGADNVDIRSGYLIGSATSSKSIYECYYTGGDGIKYGIYMDSNVKSTGTSNNAIGNQSSASTSAFAFKTSGSTLLTSYPSLSDVYWTTDGDTKVPYLSLGA